MLYACATRFDVTENLKFFANFFKELNKSLPRNAFVTGMVWPSAHVRSRGHIFAQVCVENQTKPYKIRTKLGTTMIQYG